MVHQPSPHQSSNQKYTLSLSRQYSASKDKAITGESTAHSRSLHLLEETMQTLLLPSPAVAAGPSSSTSHFPPRRPIPARHVSNFTLSLPHTSNSKPLSSSKTLRSLSFPSPSYAAPAHRGPKLSFTVRASQISTPNDDTEKAKLTQVGSLSHLQTSIWLLWKMLVLLKIQFMSIGLFCAFLFLVFG